MTINILAIINILFFLATLIINGLGAKGFFNGKGQAEVSKKYQTLITPNNFAFSIWGIIYSLLLITLTVLLFQQNNPAVANIIQLISPLFILTSILNMGWIISFSYEKMFLSTVFIFWMMLSLMTIIKRLAGNESSFSNNLAATAFTLYASWVLIATVINFSILLIQKEWNRWGISDSNWTIIILISALIFTGAYTLIYQNALFPLAIAWAFYGIHSSYLEGKIKVDNSAFIQKILIIGIVLLLFLVAYIFFMNGFSILDM